MVVKSAIGCRGWGTHRRERRGGGIHHREHGEHRGGLWIPAFAGMTGGREMAGIHRRERRGGGLTTENTESTERGIYPQPSPRVGVRGKLSPANGRGG